MEVRDLMEPAVHTTVRALADPWTFAIHSAAKGTYEQERDCSGAVESASEVADGRDLRSTREPTRTTNV